MKTAFLFAALLLAGCDGGVKYARPGEIPMYGAPVAPAESQRFEVTRVHVFQDSTAYDGWRGIYILKDKESGAEYIGVSGIGISERGSHRAGKSSRSDER